MRFQSLCLIGFLATISMTQFCRADVTQDDPVSMLSVGTKLVVEPFSWDIKPGQSFVMVRDSWGIKCALILRWTSDTFDRRINIKQTSKLDLEYYNSNSNDVAAFTQYYFHENPFPETGSLILKAAEKSGIFLIVSNHYMGPESSSWFLRIKDARFPFKALDCTGDPSRFGDEIHDWNDPSYIPPTPLIRYFSNNENNNLKFHLKIPASKEVEFP